MLYTYIWLRYDVDLTHRGNLPYLRFYVYLFAGHYVTGMHVVGFNVRGASVPSALSSP